MVEKSYLFRYINMSIKYILYNFLGFSCSSVGKESVCNAGDVSSIPGSGRSPGEENGNPLQYSCLGNPMDRGGWQATVHGVTRVGHNLGTKSPPPLSPLEGFMRKEKPAQRQFLPHSFKRSDTQPMKQKSQSNDVLAA